MFQCRPNYLDIVRTKLVKKYFLILRNAYVRSRINEISLTAIVFLQWRHQMLIFYVIVLQTVAICRMYTKIHTTQKSFHIILDRQLTFVYYVRPNSYVPIENGIQSGVIAHEIILA